MEVVGRSGRRAVGENVQPLKLRLIEAGGFVSVVGAVLFVLRSNSLVYLGLLIVGIVVLVAGLLWPKPKPKAAEAPRNEGE